MEHAAGIGDAVDHFGKGFVVGNGQNPGFTADVAQNEDQKQNHHLGKDGKNILKHGFSRFLYSFIHSTISGREIQSLRQKKRRTFWCGV
jgi:hypothetical protein